MTETDKNTTEGTAPQVKHKVKHIDFRVTEEQYESIAKEAAGCGKTISDYCRDLVIGFIPHLLMTEAQEKALAGLVAARSELVHFRTALLALPPSKRKQLFKSPEFMKKWQGYINGLIKYWGEIRNHFLDIHEDDSIRKIDTARKGDGTVHN